MCRLQESIKAKGLRDDITVLVVDLLPSDVAQMDRNACPVPKGSTGAKSLLQRFKVRVCLGSRGTDLDAVPGLSALFCVLSGGPCCHQHLAGM